MNLNENIEVQRGTSYPHDDLSWIVDQLKLLLVVYCGFVVLLSSVSIVVIMEGDL